ncbi:DEAD/DEAH box helicase [Desulforamulus ruminis]|uniref:DEAD/DEAH box helicase n=1 Tax=Desulforamulus ruminis TaxID=1564 RepID=UPI002FD8A334
MIVVVHLGHFDGQWLLWGEGPVDEVKTTRGRNRKVKKQKAGPLPYDAAKNLARVLEAAGMADSRRTIENETTVVWLPTTAGHPLGSSLIVSQRPTDLGNLELAAWKVSTINLPTREVVDFLTSCLGQRTLAPGIILGSDIQYWIQVLRFAGSLAARGKFLPGISKKQNYYAVWEPLITGDDLGTLKALADAMPGVCRALTFADTLPSAASPLAVLSEVIGELTDTMVRAAAGKIDEKNFDSIHDRWLYALKAPSGELEGPKAELKQFFTQVKEWQRKLFLLEGAPFRLCFRLEEPEQEGVDRWSVNYLLQASDDPSLVMPVKEAWQARGLKTVIFKERNVSVPELVLTALGQAAGLCPMIESSLKTKIPDGYQLDTTAAYEFLTEKAPILEQAGYIIQVPSWWTKKGTGLKLAASARVSSPMCPASAGLSLDKVIAFDWEISVGGEPLSWEELENLARIKSKLVKLKGQWVEVDAANIQAILKNYKNGSKMTARDLVRLSMGAQPAPGDLEFGGVKANGWLAELMDKLTGRVPWQEESLPLGLKGKLRQYQLRGYSWLRFISLWGFGACLADDMGLGKTVQTLALIQKYREEGETHPVLLICPTSLVGNWQREAARFTPDLPVVIHHGAGRSRKHSTFQKEVKGRGMVISSYSLLYRDFKLFNSIDWAGVILDEAQNIKNASTKQAQAARALGAAYKIALTGTPVENNVGDLWSLLEFLNPGLLGNQASFKRNFFIPIQVNRDMMASDKLKRLTSPFILRRLKTDKSIISDLPEKLEMKVFCTLTKEQATLYAAVIKEVEDALEEVEGMQRHGLVLTTLIKLKQICNHPAQFMQDGSATTGRSGKLARLTEMCEEILSVDERALIFTQFVEMGEMLKQHLIEHFGREVLFLHGGLAKKERDRLVELFQNDQGPPFFILSIKAGGTGLNLTRANHVFHFDRWWNPAVENQATDRAFRIGQNQNVQVHKFICAGTVEEKIDQMIEGKKEVAGRVIGTGEGWMTKLSTSELKEIWALSREAVGD